FVEIDRGRHDGVVIEGHVVERTVEPVRLLGPLLFLFHLRKQTVTRNSQGFRRLELERTAKVDPFTAERGIVVTTVVRDRDELVGVGRSTRYDRVVRALVHANSRGIVAAGLVSREIGESGDIPIVRYRGCS